MRTTRLSLLLAAVVAAVLCLPENGLSDISFGDSVIGGTIEVLENKPIPPADHDFLHDPAHGGTCPGAILRTYGLEFKYKVVAWNKTAFDSGSYGWKAPIDLYKNGAYYTQQLGVDYFQIPPTFGSNKWEQTVTPNWMSSKSLGVGLYQTLSTQGWFGYVQAGTFFPTDLLSPKTSGTTEIKCTPAPGALVLGMMGLTMIGWVKRRHKCAT